MVNPKSVHWEFPKGKELLDELKNEAIKASIAAEVAKEIYVNAKRSYWRKKVTKIIGPLYSRKPTVCRIRFKDGLIKVQVISISIFSWSDEVRLNYRIKTKSGRWGKTEYWVELNESQLKLIKPINGE
jgi:hypothetical protein